MFAAARPWIFLDDSCVCVRVCVYVTCVHPATIACLFLIVTDVDTTETSLSFELCVNIFVSY